MSYRSASARAAAFDQALAEAMGATEGHGIYSVADYLSDPPAGTRRPEPEPAQAVTPDTAVGDPEPAPLDRDRVEHERQARLRRWQAVDPRERRT